MAKDTAELIFKIKADGSNAEAELRKVEAAIKKVSGGSDIANLQKGFKGAASEASNLVAIFTGSKLTGATSQITAFAGAVGALPGPVGLVTGGLAGMATIGVAAASALFGSLFDLTKQASELGSAIHDAKDQTGLSAATLSTLKFAAENANSSFEQVISGTSKFTKLLGQAASGSKEAQATLKSLGVTSYDLDTALQQATTTIGKAHDGTEQMVLAQKAFGKSGADLIPVIKQMGGDLESATKEAERLGITLTDKDIVASDAFGDSLGTLKAQAGAAAVAFTSDLMPVLTSYFSQASEWYARNQAEVRAWGSVVAIYVKIAAEDIGAAFTYIQEHAQLLRGALALVTEGLSELVIKGAQVLLQQAQAVKEAQKHQAQEAVGFIGGGLAPGIPKVGGGGRGGRGRGGGGGQNKAEEERKKAVAALEKDHKERLESYKAYLSMEEEAQKTDLDLKLKNEVEYIRDVGQLRLKALLFQKQLLEDEQNDSHLNDDDRHRVAVDIQKVDYELGKERIKIGNDVYEKIKALTEKETKDFIEATEKRRKAERKAANERAKLQLDENEKEQIRMRNSMNLSILGDSPLSIRNEAGNLVNTIKPVLPVLQMGGQALQAFAQGLGQVVQNLILMGDAGPNAMRKLVASVLAGVAVQAATMAIMETAYGIAALTPWGAAIYGPAVLHFKAAALFGTVAVATGLAGRAVAGNSFKDASGTGSSGTTPIGGDSTRYQNQQPQSRTSGTAFTSGGPIHTLARVIVQLHDKIDSMRPGDVVTVGAKQARGVIGRQTLSDIRSGHVNGKDILTASGLR